MSRPLAPIRPSLLPSIDVGAATTTGSFRLAAQHFAAAMLFLLTGAIGLLWIAPELAAGAYPSPRVAGIAHLFTLGWLTTTIFGALCQLLPVALGAPLGSTRVGQAAFWAFVPGVALFAAGVATSAVTLHHAGIALVAIGILLATGNLTVSLARATRRDVTWAAVAMALGFLVSTLVLGVVLLHNVHSGFLAQARLRVLAIHLHVALVGWALLMIVGVSHRLLPMFLLAHGADTRWTRRALLLLPPGVVLLASGIALQAAWLTWVGVALLEAGIACFVWQARLFHRARVRREVDVGMKFAASGIGFLVLAAALGPLHLVLGASHPRLATVYVLVGLLGGIVLYVVGHFYKIVPLLAWTVRFRGRMGKERVPTVAELFSSRLAHVQLGCMALGVMALGAGTAAGNVHVVRAGAALFAIGVLLFLRQIAGVAFGGRSA